MPLKTQFGYRSHLISKSDCLNRLICLQMQPQHKVMVCIPGQIREAYTEELYIKYKSPTGAAADNKRRHIDCEICGASLAAGS